MKKFKNQNAITLIALTITIIVLLILAGVALSLVLGENGITERAITASKTYDIAGAKEQVETLVGQYASEFYEKKYIQGATTADTIGKYISEKLNGQTVGDYTISTNNSQEITITNGTNTATGKINDNGSTEWSSSSSTAKWAYSTDESGNTVVTDGTQVLKIGDYVNYDPQTGAKTATYTSPADKNGYGEQVFTLSDYNYGWRVLGVDETTGEIKIVAEEFVGPTSGGYLNTVYNRTYYCFYSLMGGPDEFDKICQLYGQGKCASGARSITSYDVNCLTGFNPDSYEGYGEEFSEWGCSYVNNYYRYDIRDIPNLDRGIKELLMWGYQDGDYYFDAVHGTGTFFLGEYCVSRWSVGLRVMSGPFVGQEVIESLGYTTGNRFTVAYVGVRPVIYLQLGINLERGSRDGEWNILD